MSVLIDIPTNNQPFINIPHLCSKLNFIFGSRNEYDEFMPNEFGMELIITKRPYGRGVNLRMKLFSTEVYLPTPCTTSDLEVFITLIREITKKQNTKEVYCFNSPINVKNLSKVEKIAKLDMAEAIKHYSKIDPLENYIYIIAPFARIVIDEKEQSIFKNSQEKFDTYLAEKQSVKGINNQIIPDILISEAGVCSLIFVDAGRYLIVPKTIARIGTNQIIKEAYAINGEYEMSYSTFLEKVPHFKEQFDAERLVIKFAKKDFLALAKKPNCKTKSKSNVALRQKAKSKASLLALKLTTKDISLLDRYFEAMSNLYGVVSLQDAFVIIQKQTSNRFTEKQFLEFARLKNDEYPNYTIATLDPLKTFIDFENDIVNNELLNINNSPYKYIKRAQADKEYYTPPQSELLKYSDKHYFDNPELLKPLTTFLNNHAIIYNGYFSAKEAAQDFAIDLKRAVATIPIEPLLRSITGIKNYNEEEFLQKLAKLVQDLQNNTRLWANRGYTPIELRNSNGINLNSIRIF